MSEAASVVFWLLAGIALGAVYMVLLRSSVSAIASGGAWTVVVGPLVLRIGLAAAVLVLSARSGALPLLLALAGFLLARGVTLRRTKEG